MIFSIKTKLSEADFMKVNFRLFFMRPIFIIVYSIILLGIIAQAYFDIVNNELSLNSLPVPVLMMLVLPAIMYFSIKRNYKTNTRIRETIEYSFSEKELLIKGESFNATMNWDKYYKVTKTTNWLLLWQSRQLVNIIPMRDVIPDYHLPELKTILNNAKVRNNL